MKKALILGLVLLALVPFYADAAEFRGGETFSLPSGDVVSGNLYALGGTLNFGGTVDGDVLAAGGNLSTLGNLNKDAFLLGGTLILNGNTSEDLRFAGGNANISGKIGGEVTGAAGTITFLPGSEIQGDVYLGVGSLIFEGNAKGKVLAWAGEVYINGIIEKDLDIKYADKVKLGPNAKILGNLNYASPEEAVLESGAQVLGVTNFTRKESHRKEAEGVGKGSLPGMVSVWWLSRLLVLFILALVFTNLFKDDHRKFFEKVKSNFWSTLGKGFAILVLMPVLSLVLVFTLVGFIPALLVLMVYGAMLILASPVATLIAAWTANQTLIKKNTDLVWYEILLGAFLYKLVWAVPILGWAVGFIVYLLGLGLIGEFFSRKILAK